MVLFTSVNVLCSSGSFIWYRILMICSEGMCVKS